MTTRDVSSTALLITGASGFVGLNLAQCALAAGQRVVCFSATPIAASIVERFRSLPGRFTEAVGDVRDRALLASSMRANRVGRVAHLAAITASAERERVAADDIVSVNLAGLAAVITAAAEAGVQRVVNTGSIAVYGGQPADGALIDEDSPHTAQTLYAITKSAGEDIAARLATLHGLDGLTARLGRVFGPFEHVTGVRDTLSQIHQVTACALAGQAVAFARPCLKNWSFAPDVAAQLLTLLDADAHLHRVYNLGTDQVFTLADWCERLAARVPGFRWHVGPPDEARDTAHAEIEIDLGGARDSGLLSWQRFAAEFHPPASADLPAAFEATLASMTA